MVCVDICVCVCVWREKERAHIRTCVLTNMHTIQTYILNMLTNKHICIRTDISVVGTASVVHYTVLYEENRMTMDDVWNCTWKVKVRETQRTSERQKEREKETKQARR